MSQSSEKLIILMNETYFPPTEFDDTRITFGTPTAVDEDGWNTELPVDGIPGKGYFGEATVKYTRVPLSRMLPVSGTGITLNSQDPFTLDIVCNQLNALSGAFVDPADLEDVTFPTLTPGESSPVTLTAADDSIGWIGTVDITVLNALPNLSNVVGTTALPVLTWAGTPPGMITGRAFLWTQDFTSLRDALLPDPDTQSYTDWDSLQSSLLNRLGMASFPPGKIIDYATSDVADSNQDFDRVVVQASVMSTNQLIGPIYYHYNTFDQ